MEIALDPVILFISKAVKSNNTGRPLFASCRQANLYYIIKKQTNLQYR